MLHIDSLFDIRTGARERDNQKPLEASWLFVGQSKTIPEKEAKT